MATTVVLDVDGTLVDTNYQHAIAWHRAFREHGYRVAIWEIHRHIGMGGDQLIGALVGEEAEDADGDELRDAHTDAYAKLIGEVEAMEGASELIADLGRAGAAVILASSATKDELDHYVELLGAADRIAGATSSADAERTKPHPELVETALGKFGSEGPALMVGDSTWDVRAAAAIDLPDPRPAHRRLLRFRAPRRRRRRGRRFDRHPPRARRRPPPGPRSLTPIREAA